MILSSKEIIHQISGHIHSDERLITSTIFISIENSRVILSGTVPTLQAKEAAEEHAYKIPGVMFVDNHLNLGEGKSFTFEGEDVIAQKVWAEIEPHIFPETDYISVSTKNGIVLLSGKVNAYWKKPLIQEIACSVQGVKSVENKLTVVPDYIISDALLKQRLLKQLEQNVLAKTFSNVLLNVVNGVVSYKAILHDIDSVAALRKTIFFTPGVRDIREKIILKRN